ncbi:lytic transglycosylase domain-containing protein [Actinomycetes bacterium KLBMP 9797]
MSRLWSRCGIRTLAVALLLVGVGGGYHLGQARKLQEQEVTGQLAADADHAEFEHLKERHREYMAATARQREAHQLAAEKAAAAAKAEADRARKGQEEASRRKREEQENAAPKPYAGPIPASCEQYRGNREIGCAELLNSGFGLDQMPCLDKLWTKESGWNHKARNPSSGAYGIPQAYPGGKMRSAGSDWETNPATQIKWGLGYIKNRYGKPCDAWAHSQETGSY